MPVRRLHAAAALLACVVIGGCSPSKPAAGHKGAGDGGPAVAVVTTPAQTATVGLRLQTSGTVVAASAVEVRAQVSRTLAAIHVKEGQSVKTGDLLFTLDERADDATVAQRAAQLARDEAAAQEAERTAQRQRDLVAQGFVSQAAADAAQSAATAARASARASRAAVDAGRADASLTRIRAAGPGRVGAINLAVGAVVQAQTTLLTTITPLDPIDVVFPVPQSDLPFVAEALDDARPVRIGQGDQALIGSLRFVDNLVAANTGMVQAKARVANAGGRLWPGALVPVSVALRQLDGVVGVPQDAVVQGPQGPFVFVAVGGKSEQRMLKVQGEQDGWTWVAHEPAGVQPGDAIIVQGKQNVRPGGKVKVQALAPAAASSTASSAASNAASGPSSRAASAAASSAR